jgi:hypothetical protein
VEDIIARAQLILKIYLARSQKALEALKAGRIEEALATLSLRNAAFHNFRVVEYRAEKARLDLSRDTTLKTIYGQIETVDVELIPLMEASKEKISQMANRVATVRKKISGYHSGIKASGQISNVA